MEKQVLTEARRQTGLYLKEILKERGWTRTVLSEKSGISREQVKWVLEGTREYTIDTFLKVISALDCYFYLADREGKHLEHKDMIDKMDEDKAMDF